MDNFMMQYNYWSKHLIIRDGGVYVYKCEKCKYDQPFLSFQPKHIFIGERKICELTIFSRANDNSDFDGNILLLEREDNEYVYISGLETFKFKSDDKIIDYISFMGNNLIPYNFAGGLIYIFLIISLKIY